MTTALYHVLLPRPLAHLLTYQGPVDLQVGQCVSVPLGKKEIIGVVQEANVSADIPANKLKAIQNIYDGLVLTPQNLDWLHWCADYTMQPFGKLLKLTLNTPDVFKPQKRPRKSKFFLDASKHPSIHSVAATQDEDLSQSLILSSVSLDARIEGCSPNINNNFLSTNQNAIANELQTSVNAHTFTTHVLEGVTGSGKTLVYAAAVRAAITAGKSALVMLPEIALTQTLAARLAKYVGVTPIVWHSAQKPSIRRDTWRALCEGKPLFIVGARSALFLPYQQLGVIVIDEEHEPAYKQEEGTIYHGRDLAIARAKFENCSAILASATPSLETQANVNRGRYIHHPLLERFGAAQLPDVKLLDLRQDPPPKGHWLSPILRAALIDNTAKGEQSLLFMNRRGYAPLQLCRTCGYRLGCPNCSTWLVTHRRYHQLQCHHCGFVMPQPHVCPACGTADSWAACGPGVERIAEEVKTLLPDARIAVFTSDADDIPQQITAFENGEIDIAVGTQLLAKGHHFPELTLVGVVDADIGLGGTELRAAERTFQLLQQVGGRAGRAAKPGRVMIQTYQPEHPVLNALQHSDAGEFWALEKQYRQLAGMPPYGRLIALILSGEDERAVEQASHALAVCLHKHLPKPIQLLGPAPAPLARIRGKYRFRLLMKGAANTILQPFLKTALTQCNVPAAIDLTIDVDPQSFM